MYFLNEGDKIEVKGSGKKPYIVKMTGGVVDCSCPAWRNVGGAIDLRVCKHIRNNIDRACLLPQAHIMYDNKKAGKIKTKGRKAAVKKDTAPPVLLAHKWENEDPTGWWLSSKLDGVRNWWNGERFLSRLGNEYHAPEWFKNSLPKNVILDGELFAGRGKFRRTISTVRKLVSDSEEWKKITYVVFDAPQLTNDSGNPASFEERMEYLSNTFPKWTGEEEGGGICYLPQVRCKSSAHLLKCLKAEEEKGGEGMMLREPGSLYVEGRSKSLLKVKSFFDDEATITSYVSGKGRHKGRVGAVFVDWHGVTFKVGTGFTDKQRENPPNIGSKITFRYQEVNKSSGIPRFPSFVAARDYE